MASQIREYKRGNDFKNFLRGIFEMSNLNEKYIDLLLNDENMKIYDQVFTHESVDPEINYEVYEMLGDATLNKNVVWYIHRKFSFLNVPQGVQIISKLKNSLVSKQMLGKIAGEDFKFDDFIKSTEKEFGSKRESLREDVFEALIGATEKILDEQIRFGVGNEICRQILEAIYDQQTISFKYTDLYDPKTILKEIFDMIRAKVAPTQPPEPGIDPSEYEKDKLLYVYNSKERRIEYNKKRSLGKNQYQIKFIERTFKSTDCFKDRDTPLITLTLAQEITIIDKNGKDEKITIKLKTGSGSKKQKAEVNAAKPSIQLLKNWGIEGNIPQVFYDIPELAEKNNLKY